MYPASGRGGHDDERCACGQVRAYSSLPDSERIPLLTELSVTHKSSAGHGRLGQPAGKAKSHSCPRRGGRAIQKISRSIRLSRGRGGFPMNPKGKPPRLRLLRWLRQIFFDAAATPPCGGARRGITPYHN